MENQVKYPSVAICVLNFNGEKIIKEFLPSVLQTSYPNVEIYFIDNASSDKSVDIVQQNFSRVKIIQNSENEGFAGGYNTGLSQIKADYFVLLNSDVEVLPNWIAPIVEAMEADKTIAAAAPKIKAYQQKTHFEYAGAAGGFIDFFGYPFCRGRIFDELEKDDLQYENVTDCFWVSGAALFIRAELYKKFKGLDADFFAHMEEIDLCWRLKNAGYKITAFPQSEVYHLGGGTLNYQSANKTYLNFRNNLMMLFKNLESDLLIVIFTRLLLDAVAGLKELLTFKFAHFWAIVRAHFWCWFNFRKILKKRKATKKLIEANRIDKKNMDGFYKKSIVWQYFVKGKKKYSDLRF